MQGAHGANLSQSLQYDGQHRVPSADGPILEPDIFGSTAPSLHFKDGLTTGSVSPFLTRSEAVGALTGVASDSNLDPCSTNYFTTYAEPTAGPHPGTGSADYFTTYAEPTSGSHPDAWYTTGTTHQHRIPQIGVGSALVRHALEKTAPW